MDGADSQTLQTMITSPDILPESKLRLAILYALRYQKLPQNNIPDLVELLKQQNVPDAEVRSGCALCSGSLDARLTDNCATRPSDGPDHAQLCRRRSTAR
jgi:hypothetical protein